MATIAVSIFMRPGQREISQIMVDFRRLPSNRNVADLTLFVIVIRYVVRVGDCFIVALVAGETVGVKIGKSPVGVAGGAGCAYMSPGQRKIGYLMIESRWLPGRGSMADRAVVIELAFGMVWSDGIIVVSQMTRVTIGIQSAKLTTGVARST